MQQEGWWSYEFCYEKKLRQIHVEDDKVAHQLPLMGSLIFRAIILQSLFRFETFFQIYILSEKNALEWYGKEQIGVQKSTFSNLFKILNYISC